MSNLPAPSTPRSRGRRLLLAIVALLVVVGLAVGVIARMGPNQTSPPPPADDPFALLALSSSPYLNTGPDARYVGSDACRACHLAHDTSFRHTGMGRSMAPVDLSREPPDATYDHPLSKRRYQVRRKDGKLWHRELLLNDGKEEVVLSEYPLAYVVGSGRHSLTYLVEADGFLVESPVTWYTSRKAWAMSPGYDRPHHSGFERAVGESCLICHAGQAEAVDGSVHRMRITEPAIGCERCHGPGSLHVARHTDKKDGYQKVKDGIDYTIVNPTHLPRALAEGVCQQCHLRSSAVVTARGRNLADYRPGLPIQDFRADLRLTDPDDTMTVVGHVEQMHQSRCYQSTKTFSCSTCHNPHDEPEPAGRTAYYRAVCVNCHEPGRCKEPVARRLKKSPEDSCVQCHMPTSPTEIPHLAFTHHRVGIHVARKTSAKGDPGRPQRAGELEPFLDLSRLSAIDRRRSLGLGYLDVASTERTEEKRLHYQEKALGVLSAVHAEGLREPALEAAMARVRFALGRGDALPYAERALTYPDLTGQDRSDSLFVVADALARQHRHAEAIPILMKLNRMRRHATQWLLLADCQRAVGNTEASRQALEVAVSIDPRLTRIHQFLADHYRQQGNARKAAWHQARVIP